MVIDDAKHIFGQILGIRAGGGFGDQNGFPDFGVLRPGQNGDVFAYCFALPLQTRAS